VWVGNDDNAPMNSVTGGSIPTAIWRDFVSGAKRLRPPMAETVGLSSAPARTGSVPAAAERPNAQTNGTLTGKLKVHRGGGFELGGQAIRLAGVENLEGRLPRQVRRLLRRNPVTCTRASEPDAYNCSVGDLDLNALVLLSKAERPDSSDALEAQAADDDTPPEPRRRRSHRRLWFFHW